MMTAFDDLIVKASLFMVVAAAGIALMRRASAASRHLVWTAAFLAALLLPAARLTLPAMTLFVLPPGATPAASPLTIERAGQAREFGARPEPIVATAAGAAAVEPGPSTPAAPVPVRTWPLSSVLAGLWMAGAAAILLKAAIGAVRARQLARHARPATDRRLLTRLAGACAGLGVRRPVALLMSAQEWMPSTWGIARPAILLPVSATAWIDEHPERLDAVLAHEVAHIARVDALSQLIARLAVALLWFNPLVWFAARQARLERERACDDVVLASGLRASHYADDLLVLAQSLVPPALTSSSALAMARRSQLDRRIHALLDARVNRRGVSRLGRFVAAGLILAMLPVAAVRLAARPAAAPDDGVRPNLNLPAGSEVLPGPTAEAVGAELAAGPASAPQATPAPVPQTTPSPFANVQLLDQLSKWRLVRTAMGQQLLQRARSYVWDAQAKAEIGTVQPADTKGPETTFAAVEQATATPSLRHGAPGVIQTAGPTDAQIETIRTRFAEALRSLDAALVRFDNGLAGTAEVDTAFKTAIAALTDPPAPPQPPGRPSGAHASAPVRFVTRSGSNTAEHSFVTSSSADPWQWKPGVLPDADLIAALKNAATVPDDTKRADMLLSLASANAFNQEMVALYVAAAKGITSETERARVFAQPIRIKPSEPTSRLGSDPAPRDPSYYFQRSEADPSNARKLYELLTGQRQSVVDEFAKDTIPESTPGLTKPVALQHPLPKYTAEAMRAKIQGEVLVDVVVGTDGTVIRARVAQSLDPDYGLDESALAAAKLWTFEPGVLKGEKVPVLARLTLTFRLH